MSMYVDLLSNALDDWIGELNDADLLNHVLICRFEMLSAVPRRGESTYSALAAEIAYDRALIKLCKAHSIDVSAQDFVFPSEERDRLELALSSVNVDLNALARKRRL